MQLLLNHLGDVWGALKSAAEAGHFKGFLPTVKSVVNTLKNQGFWTHML